MKDASTAIVHMSGALPLEMAAAELMLDEAHEGLPLHQGDDNAYILGNIGGHNIVVAGPNGFITPPDLVLRLLSSFPAIRFGLLVSIGGVTTKGLDIRLGDIVVGIPIGTHGGVVQYDYRKPSHDGSFQQTGMTTMPPRIVLMTLSKVRANHEMEESRVSKFLTGLKISNRALAAKFKRPTQTDRLYLSDYIHVNDISDTCDDCDMRSPCSCYWRTAAIIPILKTSTIRHHCHMQHRTAIYS